MVTIMDEQSNLKSQAPNPKQFLIPNVQKGPSFAGGPSFSVLGHLELFRISIFQIRISEFFGKKARAEMDILTNLHHGFLIALTWQNLLFCGAGVLFGQIVGVLPGLGEKIRAGCNPVAWLGISGYLQLF